MKRNVQKNIIITGANEGIGYHMSEALLEAGHQVGVLDINTSNLDVLIEKYQATLRVYQCDIADFSKVKESIEQFHSEFQKIDYAIHNACHVVFKSIIDSSDLEYKRTFDVNVLGAVHMVKAVDPIFKSQRSGDIFLTSSGVGVMGFADMSPYVISKGAIETLAKSLNLEYKGTGIHAHIIHPPLTNTTSAQGLNIPKEFKACPKKVGIGIAKRLHKKSFVISHSFMQSIQNKVMYLMPIKLGKLMHMMTKKNLD